MSRPPATTFEHLQFHAANTPDRVALIMDDGEFTYGRFADDALRFTKALADLGIERRQIVTIHHPHFYVEWLLTIACENLGAVSVSDNAVNWKRAHYLYQHVDVGLTNTPADEEPSFQYHCLTNDWVHATLRMDLAIAQTQEINVPNLDEVTRFNRSSGSTGTPKIIPLTHWIQYYRAHRYACDGYCHKDTKFLIFPTKFHINGNLNVSQACMMTGATVVSVSEPEKALNNYNITLSLGIPANFEHLLSQLQNSFVPKKNLKIWVIGAAVSTDMRDRIGSHLTEEIISSLGTTEVNTILLMQSPEIGLIDQGVSLELRDENHQPVADGIIGNITVKTPATIKGYYKNEEETRKRFYKGWFYTGDAGIKIGPRKVKLLGRADDMVIMGGVKQSPLPIEEQLRANPKIKDAAMVGIKANDGGDLVCFALVPQDDADTAEISASLGKQLWKVYRARVIFAVMDDLPRTDNGKVSRAKVRELFRQQQETAAASR